MKVLVVFQGDSSANEKVAQTLKETLEKGDWNITQQPVYPKKKMKWYRYVKEYRKKKKIELEKAVFDVKPFDLIIVGTPVWTYKPTPVMSTYLRKLKHTKDKEFILFATCVGFSGQTIKIMSNILTTKAARVRDSFVIRSIFELDKEKLSIVKEFGEDLLKSWSE